MNYIKRYLFRFTPTICLFVFTALTIKAQEGKTYYSLLNALENPDDVFILNLSKNNLREFPKAITGLPNLRVLDLSFNRLQSLPLEISKLAHLQILDISFNALSHLPPEIGNITGLQELNVSFNKLSTIPPEIGKLKDLKSLNISFNNISKLPPEIENIEGLQLFSKKGTLKKDLLTAIKSLDKKNKSSRTFRVFCDTQVEIPEVPEVPETGKSKDNQEMMAVQLDLSGAADMDIKPSEENTSDKKKKDNKKNKKHPATSETLREMKYDYYSSSYTDTIDAPSAASFDFSFFSSDELKQLYRDAFNRKDYGQLALLQEELSKRAKEATAEDTATTIYRGSGDPLKGLNVAKTREALQPGRYYALIIGINNYKGFWSRLKNAVNDAKSTEQLLRENYHFDEIRTLYNEAATRENIMKEMEALITLAKENDNVFVYYSGHGEYRQHLNRGYWVPVDASDASTFALIPNTDIQTFLAGIRSKHTLLVTDACFSGDIFRGTTVTVPFEESEKYYRKVYDLVSRQALTAGSIEPVTDGGTGQHSVFTYYLLKSLAGNKLKYFDAGQLFEEIKIPVMNNTEQTPQLKPVKDTGDEGGQFIFIRKS